MNKGNREKEDAEETDDDKNLLEGGAVRAQEKVDTETWESLVPRQRQHGIEDKAERKTTLERGMIREKNLSHPNSIVISENVSGNYLEGKGNGASPPAFSLSSSFQS